MASGIISNNMDKMRFVKGTYTGTTGKTTVTSPRQLRNACFFYADSVFGSILFASATSASYRLVNSTGIVSREITGSNWTFEIDGLGWYSNPIFMYVF